MPIGTVSFTFSGGSGCRVPGLRFAMGSDRVPDLIMFVGRFLLCWGYSLGLFLFSCLCLIVHEWL